MPTRIASVTVAVVLVVGGPAVAVAQTPLNIVSRTSPIESTGPPRTVAAAPSAESSAQSATASGDLKVSVYPILLWVPAFTATVTVPPFPDVPNGPDLPGGTGTTSRSFDGAALAGFTIEKANWRVDADGIWAALLTQRERPVLDVNLDVLYGHVSGGVKIYKDLYGTGGVRRIALKYDVQLADRPQHFVRKPGIWNPVVGLGWHSELGSRWALHVIAEGGGPARGDLARSRPFSKVRSSASLATAQDRAGVKEGQLA